MLVCLNNFLTLQWTMKLSTPKTSADRYDWFWYSLTIILSSYSLYPFCLFLLFFIFTTTFYPFHLSFTTYLYIFNPFDWMLRNFANLIKFLSSNIHLRSCNSKSYFSFIYPKNIRYKNPCLLWSETFCSNWHLRTAPSLYHDMSNYPPRL